MIENSRNPTNCCKFCGWEFHNDIIQRIIENKEPVLCEFCGIEINISSLNTQEGFDTEKSVGKLKSNNIVEKKKKSIIKNIRKLIQPRKYSINVIFGDKDFPKIFKENLIIVISRLIYNFIKEWEQDNNVSVRRVSLENSILYYIKKKIKPIFDKRIGSNFLKNLYKINAEDFEEWLRLLQKKLDLYQDYQTHFKFFLTWLIKFVFKLVSDMWEMKNLPKFHSIILNNLKNYFRDQIFSKNLRFEQNVKFIYPTNKFIEDLRKAIKEILPKKELLYGKRLSDKNLSRLLGQKKNHIYQIKKNYKRNPNFFLNLKLLREYGQSLIVKLGVKCTKAQNLIKRYKSSNTLMKEYKQIYNYHPNIKLDYFNIIDTKEKAYWLGFIYADGALSYHIPGNKSIRFYFGLNIKDKDSRDMVYRLAETLGIEEKYVKPSYRGNMLQFVINNRTIAMHLNKHGVIIGKKKSKNIELPELGSRSLNLAFLLGYYDGDGTEGATVITTGSKKFLEQIKEKYDIKYEMRYRKSESIINGRKVKGEGWDLALGANLFNEMIRNYQFSMARKRKIFETPEEKSERMRQTCVNRAKLKITDDLLEDLKKLVWEMPLYKVAEKYKISNSRITEVCKKYKIAKPPIGYWKKEHK